MASPSEPRYKKSVMLRQITLYHLVSLDSLPYLSNILLYLPVFTKYLELMIIKTPIRLAGIIVKNKGDEAISDAGKKLETQKKQVRKR